MNLEVEDLSARSSQRYAWTVVALLVPVALLNYLDRQMLATMKSSMMVDIPSIGTDANWGLVLGTFKWVYAALSPFGGWIADRFSKRYVIVLSLFVWSAVTWATGHVKTYEQLVWARALMGISEAFYIPAALALIADYHPGGTRSRAVAIHQMGIYAGQMIGAFGGYAADAPAIGWNGAFSWCGLVGVLYSFPLFALLKNPPARLGAVTSQGGRGTISELLTNRGFHLMVLYFTLPAIAGWVVRDWMPAVLKEKFDLGQGMAGVSATLYVQIGSLIGVAVGGSLADKWMKTNIRGRIFASALGMSFFLPALFGVGNATTLAVAVGFLLLFGIGWGFFDCNNMPILCQVVRPELRATGYGIMNLVSISCGGFADWGFGVMRDRDIPLNVIFGAFALVALLSIFVVLKIRPRPELVDSNVVH